jgi:hypothetical protein
VPGELEVSVLNATKDPQVDLLCRGRYCCCLGQLKLSMAPTGCRLPTPYCI